MKKARLSVYLDPEMMAQLTELADQKQKPKSLIAEAAIMSFLTPDDADRREATLVRRLDLLTRQGERLERDLWVAAETLALFIRFWLTVTTPLPRWRTSRRPGEGARALRRVPADRGPTARQGQERAARIVV